jgi:hypothetical protein
MDLDQDIYTYEDVELTTTVMTKHWMDQLEESI